MSSNVESITNRSDTNWAELARQLGPAFAQRASIADDEDRFVGENYAELRKHRLFAAAVPAKLGGGSATLNDLSHFLRSLAPYCASTALALSMHTHQVLLLAWRWQHENAPVEPLLRRIAAEQLVLVGTGGSDWLNSSCKAERTDGGWRIYGRKIFGSGSPDGSLLMTSAIVGGETGNEVLHFGVPLRTDGVHVENNWRALGMRGSGSHDITLNGVFIPDAAVGLRRQAGKWSPLFHQITMIALPIICSVYTGLADAARDVALARARKRLTGRREESISVAGDLESHWMAADLWQRHLVDLAMSHKPGPELTNRIMQARVAVAEAAMRTVEAAVTLTGGEAFLRQSPIERLWRDVQAARFHPLQQARQRRYTGRMALGLSIDE